MSRENVELVRGLQPGPDIDMAAMLKDDAAASTMFEAIGSLFHPGFECVTVASIQGERRYPGLDGLRTAWLDWLEPWESYRTEIEDVFGVGDDVVVLVRDYGKPYGMQAETAVEGASIWTVRAGKVARVAFYVDRAEALEAVGLREQAMSQENVEVVRGIYDAVARRDDVTPFEVYAEDMVWDVSQARRAIVMGPVYKGHAGARQFWRDALASFGQVDLEVEELIDAGDQVVAVIREREIGRTSGAPVEAVHLAVWTLADGKVTRMEIFDDRRQALEAVGLRE